MSAVRSSELHRAGSTVYRCGPCRRNRHDKCIPNRCKCSETPRCGAGVDLDHAEETLRRLQAEQAAAEPATPPAPDLSAVRPQREPTQRERVLTLLAAQKDGAVSEPGGHAASLLAETLDIPTRVMTTMLWQLDRAGLIRRAVSGKRTTQITITDAGRAALGSSAGSSVARWETSTPPASVQSAGRDNPAGDVADGPADELSSGVSGGQGSPSSAVSDGGVPRSPVGPSPEAPADVEMALLAERLRARLRRSLVLAVEPFVDAHRDEAWFGRLFDLFDLGEPEQ